MKLLLDTCVLSELRHPDGAAQVKAAILRFDDHALFISVLVLGEIDKGIALLPVSRKKQELQEWRHRLQTQFHDRLIGIDEEIASRWGVMTAAAQLRGDMIPAVDGLLAATALQHGLHIATRNHRHFNMAQVPVYDPWTE